MAALAHIAKIMIIVSPKLCAVNAILTDCFETPVACSRAGYACSLSTNATPTPDLMLLDYRTA